MYSLTISTYSKMIPRINNNRWNKTLISLENDIKSFKIKSIFKSNYAKINETLIFMNIDYFIKNKILHNSGINYQVKTKI